MYSQRSPLITFPSSKDEDSIWLYSDSRFSFWRRKINKIYSNFIMHYLSSWFWHNSWKQWIFVTSSDTLKFFILWKRKPPDPVDIFTSYLEMYSLFARHCHYSLIMPSNDILICICAYPGYNEGIKHSYQILYRLLHWKRVGFLAPSYNKGQRSWD